MNIIMSKVDVLRLIRLLDCIDWNDIDENLKTMEPEYIKLKGVEEAKNLNFDSISLDFYTYSQFETIYEKYKNNLPTPRVRPL